jgi:F420 biosynthesis protein FbiB-like protein
MSNDSRRIAAVLSSHEINPAAAAFGPLPLNKSMQSPEVLPPQAVHRLLKSRRSIRRFEPASIPDDMLERVLESAMWAPSAHNRQPWRFAVVTGGAAQQALADAMATRLAADLRADGVPRELIKKDTGRSRRRLTGAAALVIVCLSLVDMDTYPDPARQQNERVMAIQSTAMAGQNLLLAAHAEGLGGVWMCGPLFCPDVVRQTLELPADWEPQGVIALGFPAETCHKTREPLADRVVYR